MTLPVVVFGYHLVAFSSTLPSFEIVRFSCLCTPFVCFLVAFLVFVLTAVYGVDGSTCQDFCCLPCSAVPAIKEVDVGPTRSSLGVVMPPQRSSKRSRKAKPDVRDRSSRPKSLPEDDEDLPQEPPEMGDSPMDAVGVSHDEWYNSAEDGFSASGESPTGASSSPAPSKPTDVELYSATAEIRKALGLPEEATYAPSFRTPARPDGEVISRPTRRADAPTTEPSESPDIVFAKAREALATQATVVAFPALRTAASRRQVRTVPDATWWEPSPNPTSTKPTPLPFSGRAHGSASWSEWGSSALRR